MSQNQTVVQSNGATEVFMNKQDDGQESPSSIARCSLDAAWKEIGCSSQPVDLPSNDQRKRSHWFHWIDKKPHPNFTEAADQLHHAEDAYQKKNYGEALDYIVQGHDAAARANLAESLETKVLSFLILVVLIVYFGWALHTLISIEYNCSSETKVVLMNPWTRTEIIGNLCKADTNPASFQSVSIPVFFWGFLGGVVWCMHGLYRWYSRRLFDIHYFYWYLLNPWVAAVLGGMFVLTVVSGLINGENLTSLKDNIAFLYLTSFVVGLATHDFLKLLIRIVSAIFGQVAAGDATREASV